MSENLDLDEIEKRIKVAWIVGLISLGLTIIFVAFLGGVLGINNQYIWFDIGLMAVLIWGTYRKSRIAATALFLYFLISKLLMWAESGKPTGIFLAVIFGYYYFRGMMATYDYHKWVAANGAAVPAALAVEPAPGAPGAPAQSAPTACPKCKAPAAPLERRCNQCGASLVQR